MSRPDPWDVVQTARSLERPTTQYFIRNIFTDFVEMHGDKLFADDAAIIAGIGRLDGTPVTVIGQEKGVSLSEKARCNFGAAHPEGYRKSLRLMKQAEKFGRPVICIVDTQGAFCGIGAEERGMGEAIARNMLEMSRLRTPVISVLIGEGGSGGAIALAVSDRVAMLENSVYSILSPEGFASILWKDASRAPEAARLMRMVARDVHDMGLVDDVIPEPPGGANAADGGEYAKVLKKYLTDTLQDLTGRPLEQLMGRRYDKFRGFGRDYIKDEDTPSAPDEAVLSIPEENQGIQSEQGHADRPAPEAADGAGARASANSDPEQRSHSEQKAPEKKSCSLLAENETLSARVTHEAASTPPDDAKQTEARTTATHTAGSAAAGWPTASAVSASPTDRTEATERRSVPDTPQKSERPHSAKNAARDSGKLREQPGESAAEHAAAASDRHSVDSATNEPATASNVPAGTPDRSVPHAAGAHTQPAREVAHSPAASGTQTSTGRPHAAQQQSAPAQKRGNAKRKRRKQKH